MRSIMHDKEDGTCYLCMKLHDDYSRKVTQEHHVIYGWGKRKLSEKYGLKVYLCWKHHTYDGGPEAVHRNKHLSLLLKKDAQRAFRTKYEIWDFVKIFGRNYLEEGDEESFEKPKDDDGFQEIDCGLGELDW